MQADFHYRFFAAVMNDRLKPYQTNGLTDEDAICNYLWNLRLCESLYPSLQTFEIGLRNALHNALTFRFGQADWYNSPKQFLAHDEMKSIDIAKDSLVRAGKLIEPGRLVAELRFGFWAALFHRRYEHAASRLWPQLLPRVFPLRPKTHFRRDHFAPRIESIRKLRNRAFHHERITHWNLPRHHAELIETIGWISPALQHAVEAIDRFPAVYGDGWQACRHAMMNYWKPPEYFI